MKNCFLFLFIISVFSCTPDGKFDEQYDGDTNLVLETPVDTFSVKREKPMTPEEIQAQRDKQETDSIIDEATTIINQGKTDITEVSTDDGSGVVLNPDIGPSFPGGSYAMDTYIAKKKIYPLVAFQNGIRGTVMVKFVVERDGKIGGIKVVRGLGYGCDESAIDLIRGMPKWIPGQKGGAGVRCAVTLPITFGQ
ncbi:MAG: energy transducer TonB [Bacteroidota bacterium]|nr:energy transducer TonB [Bacteroidota bacterium]